MTITNQQRLCCRRPVSASVIPGLILLLVGPAPAVGSDEGPTLDLAARVVEASGVRGGMCVVMGRPEANLAVALARQGSFVVHALTADAPECDRQRQWIRSQGMYGQVSAGILQQGPLPYTDNLINIMVVDGYSALAAAGSLSVEEILRVLAPLGTAYVSTSGSSSDTSSWRQELAARWGPRGVGVAELEGVDGSWVRLQKPWPVAIDQWTHFLHGPDGNPVARDRVVGPPQHYQWTGGPVWLRSHETDSSVSTMVTAAGRLFYIVDEAPISLAGDHPLPDKWFLVARDAFNGVELWKVPIRRWGWREWKGSWFSARPGDYPFDIRKRLVAVNDRVYVTLGYRAPVSVLDAKTGTLITTLENTEQASEILVKDDRLILSLHEGDRLRIAAFDTVTGKRLWVSDRAYGGTTVDYLRWKEQNGGIRPPVISPAANLATDGHVVALIDATQLVALDAASGTEKWRSSFPSSEDDARAGGIRADGNLWNGTMIVCSGTVLHASPYVLAAFSAETGDVMWSQPKKYIGHLWYEWKDVFVIDDLVWTWSAELEQGVIDVGRGARQRQQWPQSINGYDLRTGELKKEVAVGAIFRTHHHHRCYRNKATVRYVLASRRGTEFVDLEQGRHTVDNWVRGTCHVGMMPANGLQYVPPHPCQCYIEEKLTGMNVLASRLARPETPTPDDVRLQRGPAYGSIMPPRQGADPDLACDWPAFRHDAMRTGAAGTRVPDQLQPLWTESLGGGLSAPIVAGERLYIARVDAHQVVCLDAANGRPLWDFTAGGRVDSPPSFNQQTVLFGSRDGWVYCLRCDDGKLVWRFQAAPCERLMGAFGQLESVWPVHGSVLVQNGSAYFAAGRTSQLDGGIQMYRLDAATGELIARTTLEGPHYTVDNIEENYQLPMGALPDVLVGDGTNVFMRTRAFDENLQPHKRETALVVKGGYLDDSYFKRTPWRLGAGGYARLIVHDAHSAYYVRMFDSLRGLDPTVFFTPGQKGYLLFANHLGGPRETWRTRVPLRIRAMVLAQDRLFVAGPPDVVDPRDPLAAFENRKGGLLQVYDATSGEKISQHDLAAPPVFNGTAAARERFYLADESGTVTCFGTK